MNAWATFKVWSKYNIWSTQCECIVKPIHCQMRMHCQHYQMQTHCQMLMHRQQFSNGTALEVRSTDWFTKFKVDSNKKMQEYHSYNIIETSIFMAIRLTMEIKSAK